MAVADARREAPPVELPRRKPAGDDAEPRRDGKSEADIRRILDRGFARDLTSDERRALRAFLTTLKGRSAEIHDVITLFARALRRYVQSQDYQRDRVLRTLLREAQHAGVEAAAHTRPWYPTSLTLDLSAVALSQRQPSTT